MSTRATKPEIAARIETVFELRMGGAGFSDVREWALAPKDRDGKPLPPWDVSDGQLWRYIRAADKLCKERCDARADHLLARHLLRRERLYAHCLEIGDYKGALSVLRDQATLEGLYDLDPASRPTVPTDSTPPTPADVLAMLGARLREVDKADLPTAERAKLTAALSDALLRALNASDLDARLKALETQLAAQKPKRP